MNATTAARQRNDQAISADNPWPGLGAYSEEANAYFFGRDEEAKALMAMVRRDVLTALYGQSGLGKTSLIRAGLSPLLRQEGFLPVYVRLDFSGSGQSPAQQLKNALNAQCALHKVDAPSADEGVSLWQLFHHRDADFWSERNKLLTPVFVLDQFEEIFTLGRQTKANEDLAQSLLAELSGLCDARPPAALAAALEADPALADQFDFNKRGVKLLLSFREDYLPDFDGLKHQLRPGMSNRFRLTRMNGEQALQAVVKPGGRLIDQHTAAGLVRFVAGDGPAVSAPAAASPAAAAAAPDTLAPDTLAQNGAAQSDLARLEVEPALLSVVCRELNIKRQAEGREQITIDLLEGSKSQILEDFYQRALDGLTGPARRLLEERLLTGRGFRATVALDDLLEGDILTRPMVDTLVDRRLLRFDERLGLLRVELTHDVLTEVIKASRDRRRAAELEAKNEEERLRAEELGQKLRKSKLFTAFFFVLFVLALGMAAWAFYATKQAQTAEKQAVEAEEQALSQKKKAEQANASLNAMLAAASTREAEAAAAQSDWGGALIHYQKALDIQPEHVQARIGAKLALAEFRPFVGVLGMHEGAVLCQAQSPDGKTLYTGGYDDVVRMWDMATGKEGGALTGHKNTVNALAVSPDGKLLASASDDNTVKLWKLPAGKESTAFTDPKGKQYAVSFSADGSILAAGGADKVVRLWDVKTGKLVRALSGHEATVRTVRFLDTGKLLLTGSDDGKLRLWDGETFIPVEASEQKLGAVVAVEPYLSIAACVTDKGDVACWTFNGMNKQTQFVVGVPGAPVRSLAISRKAMLAYGGQDGAVGLVDLDSESHLLRAAGHDRPVTSVAFANNGKTLISTSEDGKVCLWSLENGAELGPKRTAEQVETWPAFSPDGAWLAYGLGKNLQLLNAATLSQDRTIHLSDNPLSYVAMTQRNGLPLAAALDKKGAITLLDVADNASSVLDAKPMGFIAAAAKVPRLASVDKGGDIIVFNLENKQRLFSRNVPGSFRLALSDDGRQLATVHGQIVEVWDVDSGRQSVRLQHPLGVYAAAFSPNGATLATGTDDGVVRLWDVRPSGQAASEGAGRPPRRAAEGQDSAAGPTARPGQDGGALSSASVEEGGESERTPRLKSGQESMVLRGHAGRVNSLSFDASGRYLASGGRGGKAQGVGNSKKPGQIILWDCQTGKTASVLPTQDQVVLSVAINPARLQLGACLNDGQVKVWDLDGDQQLTGCIREITGSALPVALDANGQPVPKDPLQLATDQRAAARRGVLSGLFPGAAAPAAFYDNLLGSSWMWQQIIRADDTPRLATLLGSVEGVPAKRDPFGKTPLYYAAQRGAVDALKLLAANGAAIDAPRNTQATPLVSAALAGNYEAAAFLLEQNAAIESKDNDGWTPLHAAAYSGDTRIIGLLLHKGANLNAPDAKGWTPLMRATRKGRTEAVKLLLERGALIDAADSYGWTALNHAATEGHLGIGQLLLAAGTQVGNRSTSGWTALMHAARNGQTAFVNMLLAAGADHSAKDFFGWTALIHAAREGHEQAATALLSGGADMEASDYLGVTPLLRAVNSGHVGFATMLLDKGANPKAADSYGRTIMHICVNSGKADAVMLFATGNAVDEPDKAGWTPLMYAASDGHEEITRLLLGLGANPGVVTNRGEDPVIAACKGGHAKLAEILAEAAKGANAKDAAGAAAQLAKETQTFQDLICSGYAQRYTHKNVAEARRLFTQALETAKRIQARQPVLGALRTSEVLRHLSGLEVGSNAFALGAKLALERCDILADLKAKGAVTDRTLSEAYSSATWFLLFSGEFLKARWAGELANANDPYQGSIVNLAHAYMYTGDMEKCLAIHRSRKNIRITDKSWQTIIQEDFDMLTKNGRSHPGMQTVLQALSAKD